MSDDYIKLRQEALRVLKPLKQWAHNCHGASMRLVDTGIGDRVARGFCRGVGSQHSWAVIGNDCYDADAVIIDATLWSYRNDVKGIYIGKVARYGHTPHGTGSIWEWGKPVSGSGAVIRLTPKTKLSRTALEFLRMIEPLEWRPS